MLKADPLPIERLCHSHQGSKDKLMSFIIAQCMSSGDDFSDICFTIDIGIEIEESEEVLNLGKSEGGIICHNWLSENCFSFVFDYDLTIDTHPGYIMLNII